MRILIIGAGKVGSSVAGNLVSESNDITIVDINKAKIAEIQSNYDLQGIVGDATSPSVLADAGAVDADMIIAVTANDETNLAVTLIAEQLFNVPSRIARVRNDELREYPALLSTSGFRATSVIWPEEAITNYIVQLITYPEALQVIEFSDGDVVLMSVKIVSSSKMCGRPVSALQDELPRVKVQIVSIYRQKYRLDDIDGKTVLEAGDEIFFLTTKACAHAVVKTFRVKTRRSDRVMIVGGGSLGLQLAKALDQVETVSGDAYNVKIIESDLSRCQFLSQNLSSSVLVLHGDMTDESLFVDEGIANTDLFVAVSNDDEDNIMSCLLAKKLGAHRAITLINRTDYIDLVEGTSIDIAFSPTEATLSDLLRHIRQGDVLSAHTLRRGGAEVMEIVAHGSAKNSKVIGRTVDKIAMPQGTAIGCILRTVSGVQEVFMANEVPEVLDGDQVIVFMGNKRQISEVEKLFAPSVGFF